MSSIRQAKKQLTHELILHAARDLFESQGYVATTVEDIATCAGTTRATLYLHFSSKADLLEHLVRAGEDYVVSIDDPPLEDVVREGDAAAIRSWLGGTLTRWARLRPQLALLTQTAADPGISSIVRLREDEVISRMAAALDDADRFDPASRVVRCVAAVGALETLSRRYLHAGGWQGLGRQVALEAVGDVWCRLLVAPAQVTPR